MATAFVDRNGQPFSDRIQANLIVVLEETCQNLPHGGDHEARSYVALRLTADRVVPLVLQQWVQLKAQTNQGLLVQADNDVRRLRQTLVQLVTPDAMRGRVAAVSSVFIGASNELGEFESGVVARFLGPVGAALFGGVGAMIVTGLWSALFPALRKADRLE